MKSILVVDDEQSITLALELMLSTTYRVLKAHSGEEALYSIKECRPDLILMDIMMPGMNGIETAKLIKSHPKFRNVPIILMSGANPLAHKSAGVWDDFLEKPFRSETLFKAIEEHIA